MKLALTASALIAAVTAQPGTAAAQHGARAGIPAQFHGRWAENRRACRPTHFTTVVTITRTGWSSFEEGGEVTRVGQVRGTTHYFRVHNQNGGQESDGSLALRRVGAGLVMTFQDDGEVPSSTTYIRCR